MPYEYNNDNNTATGIEKAKEKGLKDKIGIDNIGIFEFIICGLTRTTRVGRHR